MNFIKNFKFTLLGLFLGGISSLIIASKITPVFQSQSEVLILRSKGETPYKVHEETRNRWIWLRDGLSLQQNILDEKLAEEVFLKTRKNISNGTALLELREKVLITYTGADEFLFKIQVRDPQKKIALEMNQLVFKRLEELFLRAPVEVFEKSLASFTEAYPTTLRDASFQAKVAELSALHAWEQAQREASFQVLLSPSILDEAVWPKKPAILVMGLILGFLLGLVLDYALLLCKKRN